MIGLFFIWQLFYSAVFQVESSFLLAGTNQIQGFESEFTIINHPNEFLPDWYGNEIRATSSRIYQARGLGRNNSSALAVQPISSFDGEITIRLIPTDYSNPKVRFWARSLKNGTGDRAAQVSVSWSGSLDGEYTAGEVLGGSNEFPNEDQQFKLFELAIPDGFSEEATVFLRLQIRYGTGSGSCAKWLMDDFEFGDFAEDKTSPRVAGVRGFDESEVEVRFDEAVDPVFSTFLLNYKLNGIEPVGVKLKEDSLVYLIFEKKLEQSKSYELGISQIPDLEGNFLKDTLISFEFFDPTFIPEKTLVINEIMAAPKADLDLPNVEYVEIFHAGDYPIRLGGMSYSNSRSVVNLEDEWVVPGEFLLLAPENQAAVLRNYGRVIGIKSWPTLLNAGDLLSLRDDHGHGIDKISYTTASWRASDFANGGFSLEVSNPFYVCEQSDFLKPSMDQLRGTPGRQNSVFDLSPDKNSPVLNSFEFTSSKSLLLTFSKPILAEFDNSNFLFEPTLVIDSVIQLSSRQIQLVFSTEIALNTVYRLRITGVKDCSGNEYLQNEPIQLVLAEQAKIGEVLINELLFNPKTGSPKFVELVNVTEKYLQIKNWKLANSNAEGNVDQVRQLNVNSMILPPRGFVAITTNPDMLKLEFPKSAMGGFAKIAALPSYPIGGGTVVLLDSAGVVAESFTYTEDLHHPLLRDPKGVSLERLSLESPTTTAANWHSASATEEYATPGRKNSQVLSGEFDGDLIQVDPEIFDPEGSNGNTFTTIRYELDQVGWIGSIRIYSTAGRLIQVLAQNEILGASGLFTWTGTDQTGKIVRPGYYILLVELYDLSGQVKLIRKTVVIATKL